MGGLAVSPYCYILMNMTEKHFTWCPLPDILESWGKPDLGYNNFMVARWKDRKNKGSWWSSWWARTNMDAQIPLPLGVLAWPRHRIHIGWARGAPVTSTRGLQWGHPEALDTVQVKWHLLKTGISAECRGPCSIKTQPFQPSEHYMAWRRWDGYTDICRWQGSTGQESTPRGRGPWTSEAWKDIQRVVRMSDFGAPGGLNLSSVSIYRLCRHW